MAVSLRLGLLLRIALALLSALATGEAFAATLQERGGRHPSHPLTRNARAAKCKGTLLGARRTEARAVCRSFLQSRTMTVTVPAAVQTLSTTSTSVSTLKATLPDVQTTTTSTSIELVPTTTTVLQRRRRPQETGEALAKRRSRPLSLQALLAAFPPDVVADACSLFLYGHLEQAQTTTTTAAAQTTTVETTTTTTLLTTLPATSTSVSTTTTTTTSAQATQIIAVNHVVAPGFEQCVASQYSYAAQPDPVACPWTITSDGNTHIAAGRAHSGSNEAAFVLNLINANPAVPGILQQTLSGITPNKEYTLTYFRAWYSYSNPACSITVSLDADAVQDTFQDLPGGYPVVYGQHTLAFTPTSATPTLSFKALCQPAGVTGAVYVDDVSFARTV